MKTCSFLGAAAVCGALFLTAPAFAAPQAKSYQVTGPVVEVTETSITVKKGEDNWQALAKKLNLKVGDLKKMNKGIPEDQLRVGNKNGNYPFINKCSFFHVTIFLLHFLTRFSFIM